MHRPRRYRPPTRIERTVDVIVFFCGDIRFILLHVVLMTLWVLTRGFGQDSWPFGGLSTVLQAEALVLTSFVLMAQKRADAIDHEREQVEAQEVAEIYASLRELHAINVRQSEILHILRDRDSVAR